MIGVFLVLFGHSGGQWTDGGQTGAETRLDPERRIGLWTSRRVDSAPHFFGSQVDTFRDPPVGGRLYNAKPGFRCWAFGAAFQTALLQKCTCT